MFGLDTLDTLFVVWSFFLQIVLIVHFAVRKRFFESYTRRYGWWVYALSIPGLVISLVLWAGGKDWPLWLGGVLLILFSAYGTWIDYIQGIQWRKPLRKEIMFPYVTLYLAAIMFYWWPLGQLYKPLWYAFAVLFLIGTILNLTSH